MRARSFLIFAAVLSVTLCVLIRQRFSVPLSDDKKLGRLEGGQVEFATSTIIQTLNSSASKFQRTVIQVPSIAHEEFVTGTKSALNDGSDWLGQPEEPQRPTSTSTVPASKTISNEDAGAPGIVSTDLESTSTASALETTSKEDAGPPGIVLTDSDSIQSPVAPSPPGGKRFSFMESHMRDLTYWQTDQDREAVYQDLMKNRHDHWLPMIRTRSKTKGSGWFFFEPHFSCPDQQFVSVHGLWRNPYPAEHERRGEYKIPPGLWLCGIKRIAKPCVVIILTWRKLDHEKEQPGSSLAGCTLTVLEAQRISTHLPNHVEILVLDKPSNALDAVDLGLNQLQIKAEQIVLRQWICPNAPDIGKPFALLSKYDYRVFHKRVDNANVVMADYSFIRRSSPLISQIYSNEIGNAIRQIHAETQAKFEGDVKIPTWSCPDEELVGEFADGVKWICGPRRLKAPCVIYSVGSNKDSQFEQAMLKLSPCEIKVFDPGCNAEYPEGIVCKQIFFGDEDKLVNHNAMIGKQDKPGKQIKMTPMMTLHGIMRKFNHTSIDIFKIDCDGCETKVFRQLERVGFPPIGQIQIETHRTENVVIPIMQKAGFAVFHEEVNVFAPAYWELALVNLKLFNYDVTMIR